LTPKSKRAVNQKMLDIGKHVLHGSCPLDTIHAVRHRQSSNGQVSPRRFLNSVWQHNGPISFMYTVCGIRDALEQVQQGEIEIALAKKRKAVVRVEIVERRDRVPPTNPYPTRTAQRNNLVAKLDATVRVSLQSGQEQGCLTEGRIDFSPGDSNGSSSSRWWWCWRWRAVIS